MESIAFSELSLEIKLKHRISRCVYEPHMREKKLKSHIFHNIVKFKKSKPSVIINVIHNSKEDLKKFICMSIIQNWIYIHFVQIPFTSFDCIYENTNEKIMRMNEL
jgi:hypothetical protein